MFEQLARRSVETAMNLQEHENKCSWSIEQQRVTVHCPGK